MKITATKMLIEKCYRNKLFFLLSKRLSVRIHLARLVNKKTIEYNGDRDAYSVPLFSEEINRDLLKALWVLTEFDVKEHYAGENLILIIFMTRQGELYEIVHLSSKTYRIVMMAINRNVEKRDMPKRIVIVDNDDEADKISDEILQKINCVSLCTVDNDGHIESYEIGGD